MILESILYGWNKKKGWVASSSYEHNSSLSTCMKPTFDLHETNIQASTLVFS